LKRHRFIYCFLERNKLLNSNLRVLHIAPENCFINKFESIWRDSYITGDISGKNVKFKVDITKIPFENESFDFILCNHVLEHVKEDRIALIEFFRVLKKQGKLLITVPIYDNNTFEDFKINTPKERLKYFGQKDHVRKYGLDIINRIKKCGFYVKLIAPKDILLNDEIKKYALDNSEKIFYCRKNKNM
jgi:predicted SAM-dependent methyltransferase